MLIYNTIVIGRYDEALVCHQEALDVRLSTLGNTHPSALLSISKVGSALEALGDINIQCNIYLVIDSFFCILFFFVTVIIGRYEEASTYFQEALDVRRSTLGNTHPDTLVSISDVGSILHAQGDIINTYI